MDTGSSAASGGADPDVETAIVKFLTEIAPVSTGRSSIGRSRS
jgi:hypothetical protein